MDSHRWSAGLTSILCGLANAAWVGLSLGDAWRWRQAAGQVAATQERTLYRILRDNEATQYGQRYGFAHIRSVAGFQQALPLIGYDDIAGQIAQIASGGQGVLTAEPVRLLEPTSGSTAATKLIPYTGSLKAEFQRGIGPWVVSTFLRQPGLFPGQAWWSATPVVARNRLSAGGIPIGFEEESEYFGSAQSRLIRSLMAVPGAVKLIDNMDAFRYVTLLFLLRSRSLRLVSVWNPTFPMLILGPLDKWWPRLVDDIEKGSLSPPSPLDADLHVHLAHANRADPRRAAEIRDLCRGASWDNDDGRGALHRRLWPRLGLMSCWADGNAATYAARLSRLFPQARLQPKGLLATEGFVSFPLDGQPGHALSLGSHFFEFLPTEANAQPDQSTSGQECRLAHELDVGGHYEVVITTGGGLYRYRLGDVVQVVGHYRQCPLLRFVGRAGAVSDWFGEKLNERHVASALDDLLAQRGWQPAFVMLACAAQHPQPAYTLFIEQPFIEQPELSETLLRPLAEELDERLQENFHYKYCRRLGQLHPVRICPVTNGLERYIAACVAHGQRAGDVKPVALDGGDGWGEVFG